MSNRQGFRQNVKRLKYLPYDRMSVEKFPFLRISIDSKYVFGLKFSYSWVITIKPDP